MWGWTVSVFLCFGDLDECCNCGGSATLGGTQHPVEGERGGRFCSDECREESAEFAARDAERHRRLFACCPSCGFDRQEHDTGCERAS